MASTETYDLQVNGHAYELTVSTSADSLQLELAQRTSGEAWSGRFDAQCECSLWDSLRPA